MSDAKVGDLVLCRAEAPVGTVAFFGTLGAIGPRLSIVVPSAGCRDRTPIIVANDQWERIPATRDLPAAGWD